MAHEWSHGTFFWNELMTRDAEKAKKFYGDTVGWTFESMQSPMGTYWVAKMGDQPVGGLFPLSGPRFDGVPEGWMAYIAVDDVDARVKKAPAPR
jgi:predicted enzyme related to lactoylglutathione lyase